MPALRRVGHKGAHHIEHGNTLASFEAALAHDVDMIEFDVLPERDDGTGRLLLAHDYVDLRRRRDTVLTLEEGLAHLASDRFAGIDLDVDLKLPGYEERALDALGDLRTRSLVSTMEVSSLRAVRALAPDVRLGWSVPKARRDYLANPWTKVAAYGLVGMLRLRLPGMLAGAVRAGRIDAAMVHWSCVTGRLVRCLRDAGGEIYVWTVDDAARIAAFERLGVTGVITNDPRLFSGSRTPRH